MNKIITIFSLFSFLVIHQVNGQFVKAPDVLPGPHAEMEFEHELFNFGTIKQGEKVKNVFVFTNTSDHPLIIANAKGSCGCTVPEWPKEPIMPGESSHFLVVFDSKGKKGKQSKKVTITANTAQPNTFLNIKGNVEVVDKVKRRASKNKLVHPDFFKIYPNPTTDLVNISLNDHIGEQAVIEFFDHGGRLTKTKNIDQIEKGAYTIDLSNFNSGIYTATIIVEDKMRLAKQFVVK